MYLENIVFDATEPRAQGRSWEERLGSEPLTDSPEGYETRLTVPGGPVLDLCFQAVPEQPTSRSRLALDVRDGELAALVLESADVGRDREFWAWLTGWTPYDASGRAGLRHPSGRGPVLEFVPEPEPKDPAGKNPVHLDVRLDDVDDADEVAGAIAERGGHEWTADWGDLPWRLYRDPSGNEFCVLRAYASSRR